MDRFTVIPDEIHPLIKLIGVAFHSINNGTQPTSVKFTNQELERMFKLHEHLIASMSHMESLAQDRHDEEMEMHNAMPQPDLDLHWYD